MTVFTVIFISPCCVVQLWISEEIRHGCDNSLLGLTYFDLPSDEACAFLEFFGVTAGNSCSVAFGRWSLWVYTPEPSCACEWEDCLVSVAVLLPSLHLYRLIRELVSGSTGIND